MNAKAEIDDLLGEIKARMDESWDKMCFESAYDNDGARQFYDGLEQGYRWCHTKLSALSESLGAQQLPPPPPPRNHWHGMTCADNRHAWQSLIVHGEYRMTCANCGMIA